MIPGTLTLSLTLLPFAAARLKFRWRMVAAAMLLAPGSLLAGKSAPDLAVKSEPATLGGSFSGLIGAGPTVNLGGVDVIMMPGAAAGAGAASASTARPATEARRSGNAAVQAQPGSRCATLAQAGAVSRSAAVGTC